jgi:hypothetical protein
MVVFHVVRFAPFSSPADIPWGFFSFKSGFHGLATI